MFRSATPPPSPSRASMQQSPSTAPSPFGNPATRGRIITAAGLAAHNAAAMRTPPAIVPTIEHEASFPPAPALAPTETHDINNAPFPRNMDWTATKNTWTSIQANNKERAEALIAIAEAHHEISQTLSRMPDARVNKGQRNDGCLRSQKLMSGATMGHAGFLVDKLAAHNHEMSAFTDNVVKALDKSKHSDGEARDFERMKLLEEKTQMTVLHMLATVPANMRVGDLREKVRAVLLTARSEEQLPSLQHEEMAEASAANPDQEQGQVVVPTVEPMEVDTEPEANRTIVETRDALYTADENDSAKGSPQKIGTKPTATPSRIPVKAVLAKAPVPGFMQPTKNSKSKATVDSTQQCKSAANQAGIRKATVPVAIGSAAWWARKRATSVERAARSHPQPVPFKVQNKFAPAARARTAAQSPRALEASRNGTSRPQPAIASRATGALRAGVGTSSSTTSSTASGPTSGLPTRSNTIHPSRPNGGLSAVGNQSSAEAAVEALVMFTPRTATTGEYVQSLRRRRHEKLKARKMERARLPEEQAASKSPTETSTPKDPKQKMGIPQKRPEYLSSLYSLFPEEAQGKPASVLSQKRKRFFAANDTIKPNEEPSSKKRKVMVEAPVSPSEIRRIVQGPRPKRKKGVALPRLPIVSRKFTVFNDSNENDPDSCPEQSVSNNPVVEQDTSPQPLDHATLESILFPEIANGQEQPSPQELKTEGLKKTPALAPKISWNDDSFDEEDTPSPTKKVARGRPGQVYTNYQSARRRSGMSVATIRVVPKSSSLVEPSESRISEESRSTVLPTATTAPSRAATFQVFRDDHGEVEVATIRAVPKSSSLVEPSESRISEDGRTANPPTETAAPSQAFQIFQDEESAETEPPQSAFRRPGTPIPSRPFQIFVDSPSEDAAPDVPRPTFRRSGTPIPPRPVHNHIDTQSDLPDPEPSGTSQPNQTKPSEHPSNNTTPTWRTATSSTPDTPYRYPPIPSGFKTRKTRQIERAADVFGIARRSHLPAAAETAEEQDPEWTSAVEEEKEEEEEGEEEGEFKEGDSEWNIAQDLSGNVYVEDWSEEEGKQKGKGRKRKSTEFDEGEFDEDEVEEGEIVEEVKEPKRRKVETGIPRPKMGTMTGRGYGSLRAARGEDGRRRWE